MKYSKTLLILSLFTSIFIINSCKNPLEEMKNFKLNLNSKLAETLVSLKFNTNDPLIPKPENISISISGTGAKEIYDVNGNRDFSAETGIVSLIVGPNAMPSDNNPLVFTIEATADNCLPIRQDVFIFDKTKKFELTLTFVTNNQLPPSVTYKSEDLNFLGKKATDTISFEMVRGDGVKFVVKYPKTGLSFIRSKLMKFKIGETINMVEEAGDTAVLSYDTTVNSVRDIIGIRKYKDQDADEYKVTASKLEPTGSTVVKQIFVGFRIKDTVPIYQWKTVFDTIPASNVRASIYSESDFREYGFYDENNNYIDKPRLFEGVIGLPQVYLYDKNSREQISAVYSGVDAGRIIECELPSNVDYKLYTNGIIQSEAGNYYYSVKRSLALDKNDNFEALPNGKYRFTFRDRLLNATYFIYKTDITGCGFANIKINCNEVDFDYGFDGWANFSSKYVNYSFPIYNNESNGYRIPVYEGDQYFSMLIDHPVNRCAGLPPLFKKDSLKINLCNYIAAPYIYNATYNSSTYVNDKGFVPVDLTAIVQCSGGNTVLPPDLIIYYRKLECSYYNGGELRLQSGRIFSKAFQMDNAYEIRYDREASSGSGKMISIFDTVYFDSKKPEQTFEDEITKYWKGTMKYDIEKKKFTVDFIFDNKKLKYNITGCGN